MTPIEFVAARIGLGFRTQAAFADWVGISRNTVSGWERGVTPVPAPIMLIIELLRELAAAVDTCNRARADRDELAARLDRIMALTDHLEASDAQVAYENHAREKAND